MALRGSVYRRKGSPYFYIRIVDTTTQKEVKAVSSKQKRRQDAKRLIPSVIEEYLAPRETQEIGWREFCNIYYREHICHLRQSSRGQWKTVRNWVNKLLNPVTIQEIDSREISRLRSRLTDHVESLASVQSYLATLRTALIWAKDHGYVARVPAFRLPHGDWKRSQGAGGRIITKEEFERIIAAADLVRPRDGERWKFLINGLRLSGLHVSELLDLTWDDSSRGPRVEMINGIPFFRIRVVDETTSRARIQPITPELWSLISRTPKEDRTGLVFKVTNPKTGKQLTKKRVMRIISAIGHRANVLTDASTGKTATSRDIGGVAAAAELSRPSVVDGDTRRR